MFVSLGLANDIVDVIVDEQGYKLLGQEGHQAAC